MTEETEIVSQEQSSQEEQVQEPVEAPQPLTEERVQQLIAEATAKAVEEAKQLGRRELQSQQERNKAERRRTDVLPRSVLDTLDEDTRKDVELATYRTREAELNQQSQVEQQREQFMRTLKEELETLGIDPDDKGIDYALDAETYAEGRKRFTSSVAKIQQSARTASEKAAEDRFKELTANLRKELNLDVTDTSVSGGTNTSDDTFMAKYNEGDLDSPADHKRAAQILNKLGE
jgi:hypothetical protein